MQLPFSDANAVHFRKPTPHRGNGNATTAAYKPSLLAVNRNVDLDHANSEADQPPVLELDKAETFAVVKQTINDLEAQGLLMLFDRHDQVAKRLTGDLIAACVLQEDMHPSESE